MWDLNTCSARQLASTPGIDRKLAGSIVKYRKIYGRFKHLDELWRVNGMSRCVYRILKSQCRVAGQRELPLTMGSKPKARLDLTHSMINFVCEGKPVPRQKSPPKCRPSNKIKASKTNESSQDTPRRISPGKGTTRSGKPYRKQTNSEISVLRQMTKNQRSINLGKSKSAWVSVTKNSLKEKPTTLSSQKSPRISTKQRKRKSPTQVKSDTAKAAASAAAAAAARGGGKKSPPPRRTAWTSPQADPEPASVTLKASPSGHNINLSCTIDKRMLKYPTALAVHLDKKAIAHTYFTGETGPAAGSTPKGTPLIAQGTTAGYLPDQTPKPLQDDGYVGPQVSEKGDSEVGVDNPTALTWTPQRDMTYSDLLPSINATKGSSVSSRSVLPLTQENLAVLERRTAMSPPEKLRRVESWVEKVNEARNLGRFQRSRAGGVSTKDMQLSKAKAVRLRTDLIRRPLARQAVKKAGKRQLSAALLQTADMDAVSSLSSEESSSAGIPHDVHKGDIRVHVVPVDKEAVKYRVSLQDVKKTSDDVKQAERKQPKGGAGARGTTGSKGVETSFEPQKKVKHPFRCHQHTSNDGDESTMFGYSHADDDDVMACSIM